jgi:hypothetical protein
MLHLLLFPLAWATHAGQWINDRVLSPFQIGTTAKNVTEEELGCYGVLAYLVYKVSRLTFDAAVLLEARWLSSALRAAALLAALVVEAWLLTCLYVGTLIPILDLRVSYGGLLLSPIVAWLALAYSLAAERVRRRRAELDAQDGMED